MAPSRPARPGRRQPCAGAAPGARSALHGHRQRLAARSSPARSHGSRHPSVSVHPSVWRGASPAVALGWRQTLGWIALLGMALTEPSDRPDVPTIDGVPLTPKARQLAGPPTFETVEEERAPPQAEARRRAAHLRPLRLRRGRRRPHHGARPRVPRPLLGQPVRPQLPPHARQRPDPRQPPRRRRVRQPSRSTGPRSCIHSAIHQARPDVVAAAHSHSPYGKSFSSLGIPLDPLTQDACIFYEDHTRDHRAGRRRRVRRSRPARSSPPRSRPARRRSTRTTACSPSARPSTRPCSGSSRWSARARPS